MPLEGFVLAELASFIGVVCGACAIMVRQIQKSRCKLVQCFCLKCERDVPPMDDDPVDNPPIGVNNGGSDT